MADIKLQVYRGNLGPEYVDFRGAGNVGAPEDNHRTVAEYRENDDADIADILATAPTLNKHLAKLTEKQPSAFGPVATLVGLGGDGPVKMALRIYDND